MGQSLYTPGPLWVNPCIHQAHCGSIPVYTRPIVGQFLYTPGPLWVSSCIHQADRGSVTVYTRPIVGQFLYTPGRSWVSYCIYQAHYGSVFIYTWPIVAHSLSAPGPLWVGFYIHQAHCGSSYMPWLWIRTPVRVLERVHIKPLLTCPVVFQWYCVPGSLTGYIVHNQMHVGPISYQFFSSTDQSRAASICLPVYSLLGFLFVGWLCKVPAIC